MQAEKQAIRTLGKGVGTFIRKPGGFDQKYVLGEKRANGYIEDAPRGGIRARNGI